MNRVRARRAPARRRTVVAIGVFDGLHRGHRIILNLVIREARRLNAVPAVVTFDRHPLDTLHPARAPRMIMSLDQRLAGLRASGIRRIVVLRFDARCAAMPASRFLETVLWRRLRPAAVVAGPDFIFGRGGRGNLALLKRWGRPRGVTVVTVHPSRVVRTFIRRCRRRGRPSPAAGGFSRPAVISSSLIRGLLFRGDVTAATRFLGRPMEIVGRVIHGDHRGRGWGIPTANLSPETRYALPPGVYAGCAWIPSPRREEGQGEGYRAVINIGRRPTVAQSSSRSHRVLRTTPRVTSRVLSVVGAASSPPVVEVHLIGTRRNLYGRRLRVRLVRRLRAEKTFTSTEALVRQIRRDIASARTMKT